MNDLKIEFKKIDKNANFGDFFFMSFCVEGVKTS